MTGSWAVLLIGAAWAAHAADWVAAVWRRGGRVAHAGEWLREATIRAAMAGGVAWAITRPGEPRAAAVAWAGVTLVWGGTALAIAGRRRLGAVWGIGVQPHGAPAAGALYSTVRHPIYAGTVVALVGQWAALGNLPSLLLVAGALAVVGWKVAREGALLRGARAPDS